MRSIFKKIVTIALTIAFFAISAANVSFADSSEISTLDQTTEFLSIVVGLDMTKYSLDLPFPPPGYENRPLPTPPISDPADIDGLLDIEVQATILNMLEVHWKQ